MHIPPIKQSRFSWATSINAIIVLVCLYQIECQPGPAPIPPTTLVRFALMEASIAEGIQYIHQLSWLWARADHTD